MEENQVSFTALVSTFVRAYHLKNGKPAIFNDFLAHDFLTADEHKALEQNLPELLKAVNPKRAASSPNQSTALDWAIQDTLNPSTILSRARYTEDTLEAEVNRGMKQYVILGAGMDTFAFRRPELVEKLQVFEVDHPKTQAFKRKRITQLGWKHPSQLHLVPVDFTRDNLFEELCRSSFNPQRQSFFSWLGVSYYLTREVVFATLRNIVNFCPAGTTIIFDYLDCDAFVPGRMDRNAEILQMIGQKLGEPLKAGFDPSSLFSELESIGLHLLENLSPTDIDEHYFQGRTDNYHASDHFHFARAAVV